MTDKKKSNSGRWLMVLVVVVLVVVIGVVTWSLTARRTQPTRTGQTVTNDIPAAPASSEPATTTEQPSTVSSSQPANSEPATATEQLPAAPSAPVGTSVGQTAPDFTLKDLDGKSVSLHEFRGHVVILDFWASWCPPCRASMPTLDNFAAKYSDKGLMMIGVSLDRSAGDASSFLNTNGYHRLIALWGSVSASQGVARKYGVSAIPHTFVIDRDGIIRFVDHPMRLTESFLDSLL